MALGTLALWILATATLLGVPAYAWRARGRDYALFGFVSLAVSIPGALIIGGRLSELMPPDQHFWLDLLLGFGMVAAAAHLAGLVKPRLRRALFRRLVSIPGLAFLAGGALAGLWLLALLPLRAVLGMFGFDRALDALRWLDATPLTIAVLSVITSSRLVPEVVRVSVASDGPPEVARLPVERYRRRRPRPLETRPLRIVQIADPHLGPWQPVTKLRRRIETLIAHEPDLVVLTGDFLTMEGVGTPGALARALEPLARVRGRSFAIFGNHDHESPGEVRRALEANGVELLVDEEATLETPVGPVQIIGADYPGRRRRERIEALLQRFPRRDGHLCLLLLHDPRGFRHVPKGDVDLTLSGHTHGGQLGLLSFGIDWTVLRRSAWPDHGLFGHGSNRLYVHRGTGFYGFPLRVGVPGEASVLELSKAG